MTTSHPAYELQVKDRRVSTLDEPRASTVVDIDLQLDMGTPVDSLVVRLGRVGGLAPELGDDVHLDLGYVGEDLERVFTGTVVALQPGVTVMRFVAHGKTDALVRDRQDSTHLAKKRSQVVESLASALGLEVDADTSDATVPYVVIDSRRSLYDQLRLLADQLGWDLYADEEGTIVFRPFSGTLTSHVLVWGQHIVDVTATRRRRPSGVVEVFGESAGGTGTGREFWLTKDFGPRHGQAGDGTPTLLLERAAIRDRATAATAATAADQRLAESTLEGEVLIQGRGQLRLGDAITLQGTPDDDLATTHQVRSVRHRLTKRTGFTTLVGFRRIASTFTSPL